MGSVTQKGPLMPWEAESVLYQKKDGRAWPRPSFFRDDTDFSEFDFAEIIDHIVLVWHR